MFLLKIFRFPHGRRNNSGIILLTVLWIMVILSILALSLSHKTKIELALTKYSINKVKSKYLAWAGLNYSLEQTRLDDEDSKSSESDMAYYCARRKDENVSPEDLFKKQALIDGYFSVQYQQPGSGTGQIQGTIIGQVFKKNVAVTESQQHGAGEGLVTYYGLQDEERKININALNAQNVNFLISLITLLGFDEETARVVGYSVLDWKDRDNSLSEENYGAEDPSYMSLPRPYHCKNSFFDAKEELLLVRGMTPEIFHKIEPYITIFPKQEVPRFNFDTATPTVLKSIFRAFTGVATNTNIADADNLANKFVEYRAGSDGVEYTADDRPIDVVDIQSRLDANEKILLLIADQFRTQKSNLINIGAKGVEGNSKVETNIEATIDRSSHAILYWHRH